MVLLRIEETRPRKGQPGVQPSVVGIVLYAVWAAVALPAAAAPPDGLSPSSSVDTIVVHGQKLSVENKIDRKVYSVPEDAQSTLGTLSDILGVIPSIDVDPDGIVSLRGDTNVLILIDGKPATRLQGSKAGDNLQSISAQDIERIEVLTTPPAQFKAEGTAGVINIITRKNRGKGAASGSLQASVGDGGRAIVGAGGTYGSKRLTGSANVGYRQDYRQRTVQSVLVGPSPTTGEMLMSSDHISEHANRNIPSADFSLEYDPNDRQSISGSGSWTRRGGLRTYTQIDESTLQSGTLTSSTSRLSRGHDPEDDYDTVLKFVQTLSEPGETLDFSLHRSSSHQHERYDYTNDSFVPPAAPFYNNLSFTEDHGLTEADLDYSLPLSKTQILKLGYSFERDDYGFENVGAYVEAVTGAITINPDLTNDFKYHQRINAIYVSHQASIGMWTWLAGVRGEWTTTEAIQETDRLSIPSQYTDLYPSLHVDRTLSQHSTLFFGASRRITRPNPNSLDPYLDHEYTPNLREGNPYLRPQFTQSFDLGYATEGSRSTYGLTAYYRRNKDSATDVTEDLGGGLLLTTRTNLPKNNAAGLEFSATGHLLPKLSYSLSGDAFYSQIDASALGIPGLRSTTGLNVKAKLDYRPVADDSAQITFTRTDKRLTPQGEITALNIVNLGYKHTLTAALAAVATISDVFNGQRFQRVAVTPLFTQVYQRRIEGRVVFVGLTYSLGGTKKDKAPGFEYDSGD
jgi:outer membrane receptor protein involved in Fe transport